MLGAGAKSGEPRPGSRGDRRPWRVTGQRACGVFGKGGQVWGPGGRYRLKAMGAEVVPAFLQARAARGRQVLPCEGARCRFSLGGQSASPLGTTCGPAPPPRRPVSRFCSPWARRSFPSFSFLESRKNECHLSCSSPASITVSRRSTFAFPAHAGRFSLNLRSCFSAAKR